MTVVLKMITVQMDLWAWLEAPNVFPYLEVVQNLVDHHSLAQDSGSVLVVRLQEDRSDQAADSYHQVEIVN